MHQMQLGHLGNRTGRRATDLDQSHDESDAVICGQAAVAPKLEKHRCQGVFSILRRHARVREVALCDVASYATRMWMDSS